MKKRKIAAAAVFVVTSLIAAGWLTWYGAIGSAQAAMAEFRIDKLTCGSCVANVEKALGAVGGVSSVDINLTSNRGRITFDPERTSANDIGRAISAAGYPAELRNQLSASEYRDLLGEQAQMSKTHVARIGDRLVSRADFDTQVAFRYPVGTLPAEQMDSARAAVWQEVQQRELLLAAAERNSIIIQQGEVDLRLKELAGGHAGFEQLVAARYGSLDTFRTLLHQDMVINRNLEDNVYRGETSPRERQRLFRTWYADLAGTTEIQVFDENLKAARSGGCGGSCCG